MPLSPYVHVIHRYPPALGGAESYFARLTQYLAQQGDCVSVHTSNALDLEAFWRSSARHLPATKQTQSLLSLRRHAIRYYPGRKVLLKALSMLPHPWIQGLTLPASPQLPSLWSHACNANTPIKLIHASAFPYTFPLFCSLAWARRLEVPLVLTPFLHLGDHTAVADRTRQSYLNRPLRYLLLQADRIFVQTRLEQQAVLEQGVQADRIVLQGLGCDPAECTGGSRERGNLRWQRTELNALCIGHLANLSEEKGSVALLQAATILHEQGVPFTMLLAGPSMPSFRKAWRMLPSVVRSHIQLLGILTDEEKPDFYAALDVFALPSRSDSFGLVLLEAWANGIPCIGYRAGGIAEVIRHDEDGILVPCGDVPALASQLAVLLRSDSKRATLGLQGKKKVASEHQWEDKLAIVRRVYQAIT